MRRFWGTKIALRRATCDCNTLHVPLLFSVTVIYDEKWPQKVLKGREEHRLKSEMAVRQVLWPGVPESFTVTFDNHDKHMVAEREKEGEKGRDILIKTSSFL